MQYRKPRISRVIYPHTFAHFETQSPSEKKGRPADRLSCIIEVRNRLKGEHMAAEERIGAQSTFSRVILYATVSSGIVAAYLRGILDVNSRKGYRQSGRLAGFGSQERSLVSVVTVEESKCEIYKEFSLYRHYLRISPRYLSRASQRWDSQDVWWRGTQAAEAGLFGRGVRGFS
jgi:hypothetical protein